jgi:drug/metabolite transporter (DMT)-like permease
VTLSSPAPASPAPTHGTAQHGRPATRRDAGHPAATGLLVAVLSSAAFGTSGAVGRSMLDTGWTPGAVVLLRITLAAVLMAVPTALALRGRWFLLRRNAGLVVAYGVLAVAGAQLAYFSAIEHLSVAVALLIEYLAPVLIVGWVWARTRVRPTRLTALGVVLSMAGLVLVLDLTGDVRLSLVGVAWALVAAVGLAGYFLLAEQGGDDGMPAIALAGSGLVVGAAVLGLAGLLQVLPLQASTADVSLAGVSLPWWAAGAELAVVAGALAYALGVVAVRRLGPTLGAFVALTEVLFAVVFAWVLLGELPVPVQLLGGALIVTGVVAVRLGALRART